MPEKIAYLDCHSGVSGDMLLGAFLDAGLPVELLRAELKKLPVEGYELVYGPFVDQGISGARCDVRLLVQEQPARRYTDIVALLTGSELPLPVRERACAVFRTLGEAEATVHGVTLDEIHFHEVGAVDAIVDIVGNCLALELLGIDQLYASPLPLTRGHLRMAHGVMPLPAPATLEILRRVKAPWVPGPIEGELVTPTGAAILATLARFEMPAIAIESVGYGFGKKRLLWPNCLRACIGEAYGVAQWTSDHTNVDADVHDHTEHTHHQSAPHHHDHVQHAHV
jgi:Uncharacterized conserved protein